MVIRNVTVNDCTPETIVIGRRGTFETMQVVFDLTYLIENYGDGTAVLALKRSQDSSAYPAVAAQDGNALIWVVSEVDTYYVGAGVCQLMWYVDDGLAKTIIYPMVVMKDILSTSEEPPDGYENWVEHLTELGAETQQNALNAAHSATEAETAQGKAEDAQSAAEDAQEAAEEAAERAETAIVHAPVIQGGYWYIWNDGQYVNTNVRAEGEKGDKGDTGEKGDTGNGIASITKTGTAGLVDTYTVTYTDGTTTTFTVTNGAKGDKGDTGATGNGIASITKTGTSGNVDTYTITYTNGQTTTFTVTNGTVSSVAGKTGAVTLDANDVAFSESGTYDDGTVGKELSDQKNAIGELNNALNYGKTATPGYILTASNEGHGSIWSPVGLPTDEQTATAVQAWLNDHPEATTTVQDGSITEAKLNSALKDDLIMFVSNATELASAISNGNEIIAFTNDTSIEISSMITIPDGTTIIGNGAKFIRASGFDGKMINAGSNCNISNIQIDGNRSTVVSPTWYKTIEISLNGFCTLENCIFEHGNECVIAYGDCNRITHCKFTDCGGNAVHFSGGRYTVVDGCYVSGANKKSGMGHENGCIIWSSECAYATCVNNYCEDAKSGFGQIGSIHAGYVKIIGNTVKDCLYACVVGNSASDTASAREIVIANNIFINCVKIDLYKTVTVTCDIGRVTIVGNNLVETAIMADRMTNTLISENNLRGKVAQISMQRCSNCVITNNIINNIANIEKAILLYVCYGCHIVGNYVRGGKEALWANGCADCNFDSNKISAYCSSDSDISINIPANGVFRNNIVRTYGRGLNAGTGCQIVANQFWLANESTAVRTWGGTSNAIVALNITNKTNSLSGTSDGYVGNITGATADVFTTATLTLTNITSNGVTTAILGDDYICKLTADVGYDLPDTITVSVNGVTLYASEYVYDKTTGDVEIYGIVGAVVITATGVSE